MKKNPSRRVKDNEFKCAMCGGIFEKGWSDKDAKKELDDVFQFFTPEDCDLICDDCYRKFMEHAPLGVKVENCHFAQHSNGGSKNSVGMWELEHLVQYCRNTQTEINGRWVPARPENFKLRCCSLWKRLRYAWQVVIGRAETFVWPEGQ